MGKRSSAQWRAQDSGNALSRRKIFKGAVGVAAAGVAGGSVLAEAGASPALAAPAARVGRAARGSTLAVAATTVEPGAVAPAVVGLTDAATIAVNASLGNDFRVTLGGNRIMGNPSNPADGQKITFQITQGGGGSQAITWGGSYEFSTGLPEPTLSTTAGDTDLLGFIYNADKDRWLLAGYVRGFASTAQTGPPPGTFRLFPSTAGPSSAVSYSGPFIAGVAFKVTSGGTWFDGYWWWVCPSGQSTSAQKFALWQVYTNATGSLIASGNVTSGVLTPGQWNFVALPAPIPLAIGATYIAATGFSGGFPDTNDSFGAGDPYSAGIVSGPLTAYSDTTGSNPAPFSVNQGAFSVAGNDPTAVMPAYGYSSANFWMDLQVDTNPPAGTSYRLLPSYPTPPGTLSADTTGYTLGTEFQLSKSATLNSIWFYSAPGAGALPTRCAIWNTSTQAVVAGTDNTSPTWSGAAGSGWVSCTYSGVTLPAGDYKMAVFYGGGSTWYQVTVNYWGGAGAGAGGITSGPLTAPGTSAASSPGQATYNVGSWAYPLTYASGGNGETYWMDVEVTPA